jgi:peptidoglycan/LPS O-acetylase OafA/YrhL
MVRTDGELRGLTGVRGIAAMTVFVAHNQFQDLFPALEPLCEWMKWHDLAVDLFFMLSGFVMIHVYRDRLKLGTREGWAAYALARMARILPLYWLTLITALAIYGGASLLLKKWPAYLTTDAICTNMFLLQNWPLTFQMSINSPSWSLSVEMLCYIACIVPGLLLNGFVRSRRMLAWLVVVGLLACRVSLDSETTGWCSIGRGIIGFLIGAALPTVTDSNAKVAISALCGFVLLRSLATWSDLNSVWVVLTFPPLIWGLAGPQRTWMDSKPLLWLGDLSYSIYLWQGPLMLITYYQLRPRFVGSPIGVKILWSLIEVALLLTVSAISYSRFEMPVRKWVKDKFQC